MTCPAGSYGEFSNFTCTSCATECSICFLSDSGSCTSCSSTYYLAYGTTNCSSNCPDGQYKSNSTISLCLLCNSGCLTCNISSSNCLTCGFVEAIGAYLYYYNSKCLQQCPAGFWANSTLYTCDSCAAGCSSCFGPDLASCTACNTNTTQYYKFIGSTTCNTTCPAGQFISASIDFLCQLCSPVCVTCDTIAENCTSSNCSINYYFLNNSCLSSCPNGYYSDATQRRCLGCI